MSLRLARRSTELFFRGYGKSDDIAAAATEIDRIVADVPRIVHGTPPPDLDVGLPRLGVGLGSMHHRAKEIGGSCAVFPHGANWSGTVVRAVLPRSPR